MTRPNLRLTRPGQLPAPATGPDSLQVLDEAIDQLARLRTPYWLGDSAVQLHALASLIAQAEQLLPQAVHDARDQELTWAPDRRAPRHHPGHRRTALPEPPAINLTRITRIMPMRGRIRVGPAAGSALQSIP